MSGFPAKAAVLLSFVVLLHFSVLRHAGGGAAIEASEDAAGDYLLRSEKMFSSDRGDVGGDDPKFSRSKKMMRCLGSRQGPSPPAPTTNRMKSQVYYAPPPPAADAR